MGILIGTKFSSVCIGLNDDCYNSYESFDPNLYFSFTITYPDRELRQVDRWIRRVDDSLSAYASAISMPT